MDEESHHVMDNLTKAPQDDQLDSSLSEGAELLNLAADDGEWDLVIDDIINGDVTATDVRQSFLLQKLASATGISQQLVRKLLNILFSNQSNYDTLKYVAEEAVVRAAHCDNWDTLISFLSVSDTLLQDETNLLSVTELMASSDSLKKSRYLQIDVLVCVWRHAKQKILDSTDKRVQNTLVQLAAELNMWSRVCDLLVAKPDLNLLDKDGVSVLHRLVMCPDNRFDSLLPVLLDNGADASLKNSEGDTALHLAVNHQKIGSVGKSLQLEECNVGDPCTDFRSKIMAEYHLKCSESKKQALVKLVESCPNLDSLDSLGNTAVILAAKNENWEFLELLMEHGASTDLVDDNWRSVVHVLALTGGQMDPQLVTKVVEQCQCQLDDTDLSGSSPLHLAAHSQNWTVFKVLLHYGADPGMRDGAGYTVLHTLASTGKDQVQHVTSLFTLLTQQGVDVNIPCPAGNTVLHIAAMQKNWTLVKHLIQTEKCLLLSNLCHFPKRNLQAEELQRIVGYLTQPRINCSLGASIPSQAQESLEEGARCSESTVAQHLQSGAEVTRLQSSFEKCVRFSNWAVANELLQSCPNIDIKKLICGKPLIHVMVTLYKEDDHEIWVSFLTELLHRGLDINSRDERGRTVLMKHKALFSFPENDAKALYGVLLEKGVNPSLVDKTGNSLLTLIMDYDLLSLEMVKVLIKVGVLFCQPQFEDGVTKDALQISHLLYFSQLEQVMHVMEPVVLNIVIECGAISNFDLFFLKSAFELEEIQDSDDESINSEAEGLLEIVGEAATQPRSLESLCRLSVSRSLPLGVNRSDAVMSLPIPTLIRDYLLFTDELSLLNSLSENAGWDLWSEYDTDNEDDFYLFDEEETDEEINTEVDDDDE